MAQLTADTVTDAQIRDYFASIPHGHYATQWCIDALHAPSPMHPHRRRNARREIANLLNARAAGKGEP
jgi:hypothetical protein